MGIINQLPHLTLIVGGARSGKSEFAESLAAGSELPVHYIATLEIQSDDHEMIERVQRHRKRRPPTWIVVEEPLEPHIAINHLPSGPAIVIIDCVSLLVAKLIMDSGEANLQHTEQCVSAGIDMLSSSIDSRDDLTFIVVTGEAGLGVIPENRLARIYRDLLGLSNQALAAAAQNVWFICCGIKLKLKP